MRKQLLSAVLSVAMTVSTVAGLCPVNASAAENDQTAMGETYVLMNIPYKDFYNATDVSDKETDYDAISSATNKVGNYGKSGGAFHSGKSAETEEDGTITAVGGANGAKNEGVIWPVKVSDESVLEKLGGEEITDDSRVTVATLGRGATSSTNLVGYETLTEAPAYSYYTLSGEPDSYMELTVDGTVPIFRKGKDDIVQESTIEPTATYGSNWGDVQLNVSGASNVSGKLINAVVITAEDDKGQEKKVGLIHLNNVWSYSDIAWRVAAISGLDGKTITNIRYYCTVQDDDTSDENAPVYKNYIYDYPMELEIMPIYTGTVEAEFDSNTSISVSGLPENVENPKAKVYHTTGGRDAVYTYLTPLEVDSADDDIDPITVDIVDGKINIQSGSVTNKAGMTEKFGNPIDGTEYTIEISSDNYIINKVSATYVEGSDSQPTPDEGQTPEPTPTPDEGQTPEPTPTPDEGQTQIPAKGTILTETKTKTQYKVVKKGKTVTYLKAPNKKIKKATIPATVKISGVTYRVVGISAKAFSGCEKLKQVTIGKNVVSIGKKAFFKCKNLKTITIKTSKLTKKSVGSKAFKGINAKAKINVPKKKIAAYKTILKARGVGERASIK